MESRHGNIEIAEAVVVSETPIPSSLPLQKQPTPERPNNSSKDGEVPSPATLLKIRLTEASLNDELKDQKLRCLIS